MDTRHISDTLSVLQNQPLRFLFRSLDMLCLEFGDVLLKKVMGRDANGKAALVEGRAGKTALHIQCCFRLMQDDTVALARSDLFQPCSALANDPQYDSETFDWSPRGNNRLDEIVRERFSDLSGFVVADVSTNRLGDLTVRFTNGFRLEALVDVSGPEECWRFFEAGAKAHLVVNGQGIEEETGEDE